MSESQDTETLPTPTSTPVTTRAAAKKGPLSKKGKKNSPDSAGQSEFLSSVNDTISTLGNMIKVKTDGPGTSKSQSGSVDDDVDLWAKLLANKIRKMEPMEGVEFQLEVDSLAMQRLKKK